MRWLDRLARSLRPTGPKQLDDPDFGHIAFQGSGEGEGSWSTYQESPNKFRDDLKPVWVTVPGTEQGPSEAARRAWHELQRRYDEISGGVAALLFNQFDASFGSCPPDDVELPALSKPADILKHARLTGITIMLEQGAQQPAFQLDYGFEWDPEHGYWVSVRQWKATDLEVSG